MSEILNRFDEYVERITSKDRVAIYTGPDVDGLSSAAITSVAIDRLRQKPVDLFLYEETNRPGLSQENRTLLYDRGINRLIVLDIAIDNAPEETLKVLEGIDTLVLDHHSTVQDLNERGIVFVKPQFFSDVEPVRYSTSKMSYDLFGKKVDLADLDWISALGILSDSAYPAWGEFVDRVAEKHCIYYSKGEVWKSRLGLAVTTLNRALLHDVRHAPECLEILVTSKGPQDLLRSNLRGYGREVDVEIDRLLEGFEKESQRFHGGNTIFYEISSPFGVCSTLSTILSHRSVRPSDNLVVVQPKAEKCVINFRRQDKKVNMADVARKSVEGFTDASGGGHIPAAGAEILTQDLSRYKTRLLDLLESVEKINS